MYSWHFNFKFLLTATFAFLIDQILVIFSFRTLFWSKKRYFRGPPQHSGFVSAYHPGFESQAYHLHFYSQILYSNCHCIEKRTKIYKKRSGLAQIFKKRCIWRIFCPPVGLRHFLLSLMTFKAFLLSIEKEKTSFFPRESHRGHSAESTFYCCRIDLKVIIFVTKSRQVQADTQFVH